MEINFIPLQIHGDERGSLIALEESNNIPFAIKRVYYIFNTGKNIRRGLHAHKNLKQIAIAICGSCDFLLDNGSERVEIKLDDPTKGLLIDSCIWREMYNFSEDCILMVLANAIYEEADYIRDYNTFLNEVKNV
ncbi:WxcM-like domain-containing protein [Buttiauxella warmboldiae]|uniref:WxcM-like domain-containing protein n=1 Tax=Buttiauxella warmboldiae TaxID=82993 RepID=A0A3N5DKH8_9ENTR|nr:FdtA/QdtA family cupin domain-containing protein [Buttiauxella warmboldiae]RPH28137.1 WxcM-like domain-containing protein [Buttiauxella warmboldiae]